MCSTPVGVTVVGTARIARWLLQEVCAQRLSASLWSAHPSTADAERDDPTCSTPVGVTVVGTAGDGDLRLPGGVLNACRRHCGRHSIRAVEDVSSVMSAQRLSASLWSARRGN